MVMQVSKSKTAGLIVDYSKNAKNLKNALELFSNYAPEDIENALLDADSQIFVLKSIFERLHDVFRDIKDVNNTNAYIEFLKDHEKEREAFYDDVKQIYQAIFRFVIRCMIFMKK